MGPCVAARMLLRGAAMEAVKVVGADSPVTWAGALSLEVHPDGSVQPYRLNHKDAPLYHGLHNGSESVFARAATPAGVRLVFLTTAEQLELTFCWRGELAQSKNMRIDLCLANDVGTCLRPASSLCCHSANDFWARTFQPFAHFDLRSVAT